MVPMRVSQARTQRLSQRNAFCAGMLLEAPSPAWLGPKPDAFTQPVILRNARLAQYFGSETKRDCVIVMAYASGSGTVAKRSRPGDWRRARLRAGGSGPRV